MKKKVVLIVSIFAILICLTGCGNSSVNKNEGKNSSDSVIETPKKDIPEGSYNDMGNGTFTISTPSGTSENGNIPVFFIDKNQLAGEDYETQMDIGVDARNFDGSKISTLYVDGVSQAKEQLADTQTSLIVSEKLTTVGVHKVEVLQFDDNGTVVTYKTASYEIKLK